MTGTELGLIVSLAFNLLMLIIACMAEDRARKIERHLKNYKELEMYADIAYGKGGRSKNPPWNTDKPDEEYDKWLTRFASYNGLVSADIQEDYNYVVDKYLHQPKNDFVKMNELPPKFKAVVEFSEAKVQEIGKKLRSS